jgi:hypothetical protein
MTSSTKTFPTPMETVGVIPRRKSSLSICLRIMLISILRCGTEQQMIPRTCSDNTIIQCHISLQWSYSFFNTNIDPDLMARLCGPHEYFNSSQQGGPLLFIQLVRDIQSISDSAAEDLRLQVSLLRIDRVPGKMSDGSLQS